MPTIDITIAVTPVHIKEVDKGGHVLSDVFGIVYFTEGRREIGSDSFEGPEDSAIKYKRGEIFDVRLLRLLDRTRPVNLELYIEAWKEPIPSERTKMVYEPLTEAERGLVSKIVSS